MCDKFPAVAPNNWAKFSRFITTGIQIYQDQIAPCHNYYSFKSRNVWLEGTFTHKRIYNRSESSRLFTKAGIPPFWNSILPCHSYCSSCSRNVLLECIFQGIVRSEILPGYSPKLKFKYFKFQLFHVSAFILLFFYKCMVDTYFSKN